jgi:uncharacterized protein (DUF983 family)
MTETNKPLAKLLDLATPILAGATGRCPCCGRGRLFSGFLTLAASCDRCGLEFDFADSGDGPAVFVFSSAGSSCSASRS